MGKDGRFGFLRRGGRAAKVPRRAASPDTPFPASRTSIPRIIALAFLFAALAVVAGGVVDYGHRAGAAADRARQAAESDARQITVSIAARLEDRFQLLEGLASDPRVAAAIRSGDTRAEAARIAVLLPAALKLRLLPQGDENPDDGSHPSLGYATLDMAHKAEAGKSPPAEIHMLGTPDQQIVLVRAVGDGGGVAGSVVASLDVKQLKRWMVAAAPRRGYFELRQNGSGVAAASAGNGSLKVGEPTIRAGVSGAAWQVVAWPPAAAGAALSGTTLPAVPLAGIALAFLVAGLLIHRLLQADLVQLVRLFTRASDGEALPSSRFRLREVRGVAAALMQSSDVAERRPRHGEVIPESEERDTRNTVGEITTETVAGGVEEEHPASTLFMDVGSVTVEELEAPPPAAGEEPLPGDEPQGAEAESVDARPEAERRNDEGPNSLEFEPGLRKLHDYEPGSEVQQHDEAHTVSFESAGDKGTDGEP